MEHLFDGVKDFAVWCLTAVFIYVGRKIGQVTDSIEQLNRNVAVIIAKLEGLDERVDRIEDRQDEVERKL